MSTVKKLIVLFLTFVFALGLVVTAQAQAVPSTVEGSAGQTITVSFKYESIRGVQGTITYSKPEMFSNVTLTQTGLIGDHNPENGKVFYDAAKPANCTITLSLTIASTAKVGDTCTISFAYKSTQDAVTFTNGTDTVTVTVSAQIDYSELQKQITTAEGLNKADYTSNSWANLETALAAAKAALSSKDQATVNNAAQALATAIGNLVKVPLPSAIDYSELQKQITRAGDLNKTDYTAASWANLETALAAAKAALNSNDQATVNNAAQTLANAIANLVKVPATSAVNYTELNRQISIAEGLKKSEYTSASWSNLETALAAAKSARNSTSQTEVDNAAKALAKAISDLRKLSPSAIDYSELEKQITIAGGLKQNEYTTASWEILANALSAGKNALKSKIQSTVDDAAKALADAIAGLVRMDYSALLEAIESVNAHKQSNNLSDLWSQMNALLARAQQLLTSGDQAAVDACAKELVDLLAQIIKEMEGLKQTETVIVDNPIEPTDDYCNINMHRVWPILFWISLALNLALIALIVVYLILKKKKEKDDTPLVDYDIADDAE